MLAQGWAAGTGSVHLEGRRRSGSTSTSPGGTGASAALAGPEGDEGGWECPCAEKAEDTPVHFSCWVQRAAAGLRGPCLGDAHCFWLVGCRNYQPHSTLRGLALCSNCLSPGDPPQRALGLMAAVRRVRAAAVRACGPHCSPFSVTARQV